MSGITIFYIMSMTLILFSGMMFLYGVTTPTISNQLQGPINCDINNSPPETCAFTKFSPPTPSNTTVTSSNAAPFPQCLLFIPSCFNGATSTITNVGNAIWNGMIQVAYGLAYFGISAFVFFNKLVQGIFLIYGITQIISTDFGIPFLQFIWTSWTVFMIIYGIILIKPAGGGA